MAKPAARLKKPEREIDVFLLPGIENRKAAIKAVSDGILPIETLSINLCWVKRWANDVNQPEGRIHGFEIKKRERGKRDGEEEA